LDGEEGLLISGAPGGDRRRVDIYTAPELCTGAKLPSHTADIWSVGCIIFELVSSYAAFETAYPGRRQVIASIASVLDVPSATEAAACGIAWEDRRWLTGTGGGSRLERWMQVVGLPSELANELELMLRWNPSARIAVAPERFHHRGGVLPDLVPLILKNPTCAGELSPGARLAAQNERTRQLTPVRVPAPVAIPAERRTRAQMEADEATLRARMALLEGELAVARGS
jgi:serine/threonine protein kinase